MFKYAYRIKVCVMTKPDDWAKEWLAKKRREDPESVKGWTLEKHGSSHYIKWGTTKWDKEAKKYRKVSEHIGTLNPNGTVTLARKIAKESKKDCEMPIRPTMDVKEFGNACILRDASEELIGPLKECFPDTYGELMALAQLRLLGNPRLNHASDSWRLMDDIRGLNPRMSDEVLSDVLKSAGESHKARERFYDMIEDKNEHHEAVDLSVIFSKSSGMKMLRKGYNRFRLKCTQFNLNVICDVKTGKPRRLCMVCGNVKENSIKGMLDQFGIDEHLVLILDRGYGGKKVLNQLVEAEHDFIVALKRDSAAYETVGTGEGHFIFEDRAINYGTGTFWGYFAYRFEDLSMRSEEIYDKYKAEEDKGREVKNLDRAGNIMILSSMKIDAREIYRMYKDRCSIENFFDTAKNDLEGDVTYLRSDLHVMGYNFVTFLAFCIWWNIRFRLKEANLESRYTPSDLLRSFAAVKIIYTMSGPVITDVPKDVRTLAERTNFSLEMIHTI